VNPLLSERIEDKPASRARFIPEEVFMMNSQLGGMLIIVLGMLLFALSMPVLRLNVRHHHHAAPPQFSDAMVKWLTRIFAITFMMLGLVTLLQH
jgi:threonine/homoserine/homoserine lactone efflux protein